MGQHGLLVFILRILDLASVVLLAVAWWKWARSSPRSRALLASQIAATLSLLMGFSLARILSAIPLPVPGVLVQSLTPMFVAAALFWALLGRGPPRLSVGLAASLQGVDWLLGFLFVPVVYGFTRFLDRLVLLGFYFGPASLLLLAVAWWKWAKSSPRSQALLASQIFGTLNIAFLPGTFLIADYTGPWYKRVFWLPGALFGALALVCMYRGQGPSRLWVILAASSWIVFLVAFVGAFSHMGSVR